MSTTLGLIKARLEESLQLVEAAIKQPPPSTGANDPREALKVIYEASQFIRASHNRIGADNADPETVANEMASKNEEIHKIAMNYISGGFVDDIGDVGPGVTQ